MSVQEVVLTNDATPPIPRPGAHSSASALLDSSFPSLDDSVEYELLPEPRPYVCLSASKLDERCLQISTRVQDERATPVYPTLEECNKKCYTPEELAALEKIKKTLLINSFTPFKLLKPKLIKTFSKIIDIPILNFDSKIYSKRIFNFNEIRTLYTTLFLKPQGIEEKNPFLIDLLNTKGCVFGERLYITELDENIESVIGIKYSKKSKQNYNFHFDNSEYKEYLKEELRLFFESINLYLIKEIRIDIEGNSSGHENAVLIKKITDVESTKFQIFLYEPNSTLDSNKLLEKIEQVFSDILTERGYNFRIYNLSKFYGVQNFETNNPNIGEIQEYFFQKIDYHFSSVYDVIKNFFRFQAVEKYKAYKTATEAFGGQVNVDMLVQAEIIIISKDIFEDHILYPVISKYIRIIYEIIHDNIEHDDNFTMELLPKKIYEILDNLNKEMNIIKFQRFDEIVNVKKETLMIQQKVKNKYNFDFFNGNCYLWSFYTFILIIINPTIDPTVIIKATFYQTSDIKKMLEIYQYNLSNVHYNYFKDEDVRKIFDKNYIKNLKEGNEEFKHDLEQNELNIEVLENSRILYIKITNLILLNILYNRLKDKYLLYSFQEKCNQKICLKNLIPEKVNEILNRFSFSFGPLTKENIISEVLEGKPIELVNYLILLDKDIQSFDYEKPEIRVGYAQNIPNSWKNKYLKYKKKYLALKAKN